MALVNPRSYLFVPGNRPDRFAKACASGADAVVLDLEDSVAPMDKTEARAAVAAWLTPAQPVMVRVNTSGSEWFHDDLRLGGKPGIAGVLLPKAEGVEDIRIVAEHFGSGVPILPQIETARGFRGALALASATQVRHLLFGSIDFQLDLGMTAEEDVVVADDGVGFADNVKLGRGLTGMSDRSRALDGKLDLLREGGRTVGAGPNVRQERQRQGR